MFLDGFGVAGYRSFGDDMQYIKDLSKVNIIIGKNNSGKSNIIRFVNLLSLITIQNSKNAFSQLNDLHRGKTTCNKISLALQIKKDSSCTGFIYKELMTPYIPYKYHMKLDWQREIWLQYHFTGGPTKFENEIIYKAIHSKLNHYDTEVLAERILHYTGGNHEKRSQDLAATFNLLNKFSYSVHIVPSFRKITAEDKDWNLEGIGLIKKLNQLKEPLVGKETEREKFNQINSFVQEILGDSTAKLDIPYTVDDIYVEMDNRRLSIESLGTGIHQVILLATAVTLLENSLVCIEELEIYLHPELQKKFIKYICENTNNQYIITTHSNAVFDNANVNIYHCWLEDGQTKCELALSSSQKSSILDSLGYKASDILQSNCIIWVEGPSDRIYINKWIKEKNPSLREGLHYSIMFYGGRLLSHLTGTDSEITEFISLKKMNRNIAIVIDSDKKNRQAPINATKTRIRDEFLSREGYCWITKGREIENYYDQTTFHQAVKSVHGDTANPVPWGQYDDVTKYAKAGETKEIDKVKVAKKLTEEATTFNQLDFDDKVTELVNFIKKANGI